MASLANNEIEELNVLESTFNRMIMAQTRGNVQNVQVFADGYIMDALGWSNGGPPVAPLSHGVRQLRMPSGSLTSLCRNGLPESYIRETLFGIDWDVSLGNDISRSGSKTNMILIQNDPQSGVRGFALISVVPGQYGVNDTTMEVLVFCNAEEPGVGRRVPKINARGGDTLRMIQFLGCKLRQGIILYALETVITMYYYFGWRFRSSCGSQERAIKKEHVKALSTFYKKWGEEEINFISSVEGEEMEREFNDHLNSVLYPFRGHAYHFFKGMLDPNIDASEAREEARENGFLMRLCWDNNPFSKEYGIRYDNDGQGNKRRKKTRNKKKKHRTKKKGKKRKRKCGKSKKKKHCKKKKKCFWSRQRGCRSKKKY